MTIRDTAFQKPLFAIARMASFNPLDGDGDCASLLDNRDILLGMVFGQNDGITFRNTDDSQICLDTMPITVKPEHAEAMYAPGESVA